MTSPSENAEVVRRIVARNDLMNAAHAAEDAVRIIQTDSLSQMAYEQGDPFGLALEAHLEGARESEIAAVRSQHWARAAAIVDFLNRVRVGTHADRDPIEMYKRAGKELSEETQDPTLEIVMKLGLVQSLRRGRRFLEAENIHSAARSESFFFGTGAEPLSGEFTLESTLVMFEMDQAFQLQGVLKEQEDEGFWRKPPQNRWPSRSRYELAWAISHMLEGETAGASKRLRAGMRVLESRTSLDMLGALGAESHGATRRLIQLVTLKIALAEYLIAQSAGARRAVELIGEAIDLLDDLRVRWRVVTRSRSPTAIAFRMLYGDIAKLVADVAARRGRAAATASSLGFHMALSAKQTGFATLLRTKPESFGDIAAVLIDEVRERENQLERGESVWSQQTRESDLRSLRAELELQFSPMLADLVLPERPDVPAILDAVRDRYVVDYVALPNSADSSATWFRTAIAPGGRIEFGEVVPRLATRYGGPEVDSWSGRSPDFWAELGQELLPESLLRALRRRSAKSRVELLVSSHAKLATVPWAAIVVNRDKETRLVERATVAQAPLLTSLTARRLPAVAGTALVGLVPGKRGVTVEPERKVWGLPKPLPPDALYRCKLHASTGRPQRVAEPLEDVLRHGNRYGLVHLAGHGVAKATGLAQAIELSEPLDAAGVMGMNWPPTVLLAACHVGMVEISEEAEPYGFVVALLVSGAEAVLAGLGEIPDEPTGEIVAAVISELRDAKSDLPTAVNAVQRASLEKRVEDWARLGVFVR
jgi:hypothetical protein